MNDFSNIKAGDRVMVCVSVHFGWNRGRSFWIEKEVSRTTNTQFLIGERRFKKEDGSEIGNYGYAKKIGEVENEIEAYTLFQKKVKTAYRIHTLIRKTDSIKIDTEMDIELLEKTEKMFNELLALFGIE